MDGRWELLIVDDDSDIVEELAEYLISEGYTCHGATSATDARRLFAEKTNVGIVMVDLRMPDEDGLTLLQGLKDAAEGQRPLETIVFTGHGGEDDVIAALRLGVSDYQKKPIDVRRLLAAVQRAEERLAQQLKSKVMEEDVSRRLDYLSASLAGFSQEIGALRNQVGSAVMPRSASAPTTPPAKPDFAANLTARQWDVLRLVGRGLNNYQIACDLGISENTVKLHVSHILKVTGMSNRTQLALAVSRWGDRQNEASQR